MNLSEIAKSKLSGEWMSGGLCGAGNVLGGKFGLDFKLEDILSDSRRIGDMESLVGALFAGKLI